MLPTKMKVDENQQTAISKERRMHVNERINDDK